LRAALEVLLFSIGDRNLEGRDELSDVPIQKVATELKISQFALHRQMQRFSRDFRAAAGAEHCSM